MSSVIHSTQVLQEELQALGPCTFEDFRSTVQVLHSRCFMQPEGRHLAVPGIDMANHSATPNAQVGVQHSPEAVQVRWLLFVQLLV